MSTQFVQAVWGGVLFGSVYGLMALGLTLVWGAVRLLNLAHGAIFVVGAYGAYWVVAFLHLPILVALPFGVLAAAAFAYAMHMVFIRPVIGKQGFDNSTLVATVGISIAVSAAALLIFNPQYKVVPPVLSGSTIVAGVQITYQGLLVIGTSLALFASTACSSGTSTPRSPPEGLMVPMNATSTIRTKCSTPGNARPVAAIRPAPKIRSARRS